MYGFSFFNQILLSLFDVLNALYVVFDHYY